MSRERLSVCEESELLFHQLSKIIFSQASGRKREGLFMSSQISVLTFLK